MFTHFYLLISHKIIPLYYNTKIIHYIYMYIHTILDITMSKNIGSYRAAATPQTQTIKTLPLVDFISTNSYRLGAKIWMNMPPAYTYDIRDRNEDFFFLCVDFDSQQILSIFSISLSLYLALSLCDSVCLCVTL
jgi:hypothetical protein